MTAALVVALFALLAGGGLLLHQWSSRRISEAPPERDLHDLADPGRWPAPPPSGNGSERERPGNPPGDDLA